MKLVFESEGESACDLPGSLTGAGFFFLGGPILIGVLVSAGGEGDNSECTGFLVSTLESARESACELPGSLTGAGFFFLGGPILIGVLFSAGGEGDNSECMGFLVSTLSDPDRTRDRDVESP